MKLQSSTEKIPWTFLIAILFASLIVIFGAVVFYESLKRKTLREKQNELGAIASLKTDEITKWRKEHIRDGMIISSIVPHNKNINNFFQKQESDETAQLLNIKAIVDAYDYTNILFFDSAGFLRFSYPSIDSISNIAPEEMPVENSDKDSVRLVDLHSSGVKGKVHIDLQIPLISEEGNEGTIIIRIDPYVSLFPLIQSWPTPSKSSETLLLRLEGDSVVFLNELRHQKNTALKLRKSVNEKDLPAGRAAMGYEGPFEGNDYRNFPVISYLRKIPDSPWFMVAKVDKDEIYSPLREQLFLISIIAIFMILSITVLTAYYWRNRRVQFYRELNVTRNSFFSIISHDLASPFSSIKGFSSLLIERLHEHKYQDVEKFARIIDESSENAVDLIRNLSAWSKLQTDKIVINRRMTDLVPVINDVIKISQGSALHKSITIRKNLPDYLEINADKEIISTILRNLISNGIKFSNPGSEIVITAVQKDGEADIEVLDFGRGIKQEIIDRLSRFGEIKSQRGTNGECGSGLGLILIRDFVALHEGKLTIESEADSFSRFTVTLPILKNGNH
jgi:signal transduction histidine kinase